METHTKPMDQSIVDLESGALGYLVNFQPGNGTRYLVGISPLEDYPAFRRATGSVREGGWLITWFGHNSCVLQPDGFLPAYYLKEKLGGSLADATVLARLIAHLTDREVEPWEPDDETE